MNIPFRSTQSVSPSPSVSAAADDVARELA
jgi:hypothetical protein